MSATRCDKLQAVSICRIGDQYEHKLGSLGSRSPAITPPVERSHLLERLIASLDLDPEVEEAWEREADHREAELESGSISAVSGQEAIARLRVLIVRHQHRKPNYAIDSAK